jgi:hypothetical protein
MSKRTKVAVALAGATLGLGAGASSALAQGGPPGRGGPPPGSAAVAQYLGLTQAQLRMQLQSGKTLAQIATAQGKSVSGLEDVIYNDAKTHLDAAVTAGKLTAAQEQTRLADLKAHLDDIVNHSGPPPGAPGRGGPPPPARP